MFAATTTTTTTTTRWAQQCASSYAKRCSGNHYVKPTTINESLTRFSRSLSSSTTKDKSSVLTPEERYNRIKQALQSKNNNNNNNNIAINTSDTFQQQQRTILQNSEIAGNKSNVSLMEKIHRSPQHKQRYSQAVWSIAGSFLLMIVSAQAVKSAAEHRQARRELQRAQEDLQDCHKVCKDLIEGTHPEFEAIVADISQLVHKQQQQQQAIPVRKSFWWSGSNANNDSTINDKDIEGFGANQKSEAEHDVIRQLVKNHLFKALSPVAYAEDQRKVIELNTLSSLVRESLQGGATNTGTLPDNKNSTHSFDESQVQLEKVITDEFGRTVVQKPVFRM